MTQLQAHKQIITTQIKIESTVPEFSNFTLGFFHALKETIALLKTG